MSQKPSNNGFFCFVKKSNIGQDMLVLKIKNTIYYNNAIFVPWLFQSIFAYAFISITYLRKVILT